MKKTVTRIATILLAMALLMAAASPAALAAPTKCDTKYPIVLVHGAGFRDSNIGINYWGRIPGALTAQGAKIYYSGTDGWCSVEQGASVLKDTINRVLKQTNSEKVNIIAHSKGGLEARYMISSLDMAEKVASLTMISTPNHGSKAMDSFFAFPDIMFRAVAVVGDVVRFVWGDKRPDFYRGTHAMGTEQMKAFNRENPDKAGVYYQSFAGAMQMPISDIVLSLTCLYIRNLEGENDGMVAVESAKWTNFRGVLRGVDTRGVSHADEVDFRRSSFNMSLNGVGSFDIRDFYVGVVAELKTKGY